MFSTNSIIAMMMHVKLMQYYYVHVLLSAAYIIIMCFIMLTFIFCTILWSYWNGSMSSPRRGCIFFVQNVTYTPERCYFTGSKRLICHTAIYWHLPFLLIALSAAMTHIFYVCQKKKIENSEIHFKGSQCMAMPKLEAITCLVCAVLSYLYGCFLVAGFLHTCKMAKSLSGKKCHNLSLTYRKLSDSDGQSCYSILQHLDYCSLMQSPRDCVSTPAILIATILFQFVTSTTWLGAFVANLLLRFYWDVGEFGL